MARPRTPLSSSGTIHLLEVSPGKWRARARYRFDDGKLRQVERFASTKAKATATLRTALTTLTASAGVDVKRETRIADLADRFLASKADRAPRTRDTYRQTVEHLVKPRIGDVSVAEATPERLQRYLDAVRLEHGPGAAKAARAVLSGMMALATRSGAKAANPVRELAPIQKTKAKGGAQPIPLDDLPELLANVRADDRLAELDMTDLVVFLAGTGCRVGEACGLRWEDIDLEAGTVTISGNAIRAKGVGVIRQDHPKTRAGERTNKLPSALVGMLVDRRVKALGSEHGLVFPTILGRIRDPRNTSRDWANARDRLGFGYVTTHSFRKTVATALDKAGLSARDIAEYLGHENPSITQDVYMNKNTGGAKAASALDALM